MTQIYFILIAGGMTILCLTLQAVVGVYAIQIFRGHAHKNKHRYPVIGSFITLAIVMVVLMLGNLLQIAAWAYLYIKLGEFDAFSEAFYFSGVTFTSLGYGDITISEQYRSLTPIEAANGLMMFGVSVSTLFAVIQNHKHVKH